MPTPLAYLNGRFLPQTDVHLALNDAGFVWGATVTDLCRTFAGRPFRLADHLRRFRQSCEAARIVMTASDDELTAVAGRLVEHNARALLPPGGDLSVVFYATPGPIGYYLGEPGGPGDGPPTLGAHTYPLPFARYHRLVREGAVLVVPSVRHLPPECVDPRVKHRSRISGWIADQEARRIEPGASALLLDADGFVTENRRRQLPHRPRQHGPVAAARLRPWRRQFGGCGGTVPRPRHFVCGTAAEAVPRSVRTCGRRGDSRQHDLLLARWPRNRPTPPRRGPGSARRAAGVSFGWFIHQPAWTCIGQIARSVDFAVPRLLDEWGRRVGVDIERQILSNR